MDATLKKKIVSALKALIKNIENGKCDNMTPEQYDKLIECLNIIIEVKQTAKSIWKFGK